MTCKKITEDMYLKDVIERHPEVIPIFTKYNMGCVGCIAASFEKIKDITAIHGIDSKQFVKELNKLLKK